MTVLPKLDRQRALFVLMKIGEIPARPTIAAEAECQREMRIAHRFTPRNDEPLNRSEKGFVTRETAGASPPERYQF